MEMRIPFNGPMTIKHDFNCNIRRATFKNKRPFDCRKDEVAAIREKFPTKVPIIVERYYKEKLLPQIDKTKFLVPQEVTMSQFVTILRSRMRVPATHAFFLLVNNRSMLSLSRTMAETYSEHQDEDGFLYVTYASQEVYGG